MEYIFGTGDKDIYEIIFAFSFIIFCATFYLESLANSLKMEERYDSNSLTYHRWSAYIGCSLLGSTISAICFNYRIGAIFYFAGIGIIYLAYGRPKRDNQ